MGTPDRLDPALAGEPIWEFVERIPNWAIPLAFLVVRGFPRTRLELLS